MRTDCKINSAGAVRLPQIPIASPGRNYIARRGDFIMWQYPDSVGADIGRVIAIVDAADLDGPHILAAALIGDSVFERWIDPAHVVDCRTVRDDCQAQWLFSPQFLATPTRVARQGPPLVDLMSASGGFIPRPRCHDFEGALWSDTTGEIVRPNYRRTVREIKSTIDLRATLRAGAYTSIGGYPLVFYCADGGALSFATVRENYREISAAIRTGADPQWRVVYCDVLWEGAEVDAHTGEPIASAYGDSDSDSDSDSD